METDYVERVDEHHKLQNGGCIVKNKYDEWLGDDIASKSYTRPSLLRFSTSSKSKRIMKHLIFFIDGTKFISVYYMETDSLYFEKNFGIN